MIPECQKTLPCDVIVEDVARTGADNMAIDEMLLDRVRQQDERCVVRIYRWSEPTVTLGYFQKDDDRNIPPHLQQCPRVRRLSGGGAILHDRELTYSCVVPPRHPIRCNPAGLYETVHRAIIRCLREQGVAASLRGSGHGQAGPQGKGEQFLCFHRADARDIVLNGRKIVGSAQRRRRGAVLQHGSILLAASPLTPDVPGLLDLHSCFDYGQFLTELPKAIAAGISGLMSFAD